jgi:hypothetical protein
MAFALYFYESEVLIVSDLNAVSKATIILRGFDYNQIREREYYFLLTWDLL